jgi:hypothetical protein
MSEFKNGDFVYLITDIDQKRGIITFIKHALGGDITYQVTIGTECSEHYKEELSSEKTFIL